MLKVYLAAPYTMKEIIKERAQDLFSNDMICTSTWLSEPHKPTTQVHEISHEENEKYALQDVRDVLEADILVFQNDPTKTIVRGGRHVEFGIAVGVGATMRRMPIFVIGEDRENIFHHLPQVKHFATWEDALHTLKHIR